jgi:hypothetical protein
MSPHDGGDGGFFKFKKKWSMVGAAPIWQGFFSTHFQKRLSTLVLQIAWSQVWSAKIETKNEHQGSLPLFGDVFFIHFQKVWHVW